MRRCKAGNFDLKYEKVQIGVYGRNGAILGWVDIEGGASFSGLEKNSIRPGQIALHSHVSFFVLMVSGVYVLGM